MRCLQVKNFHKNEKKGVPQSPNQEYVVEKIVARRTVDGEREYLLKWKGYSHRENTWEPLSNINCHGLIEKFEYERQKEIEDKLKTIALLRTENETKQRKREDSDNNYPGTSRITETSGVSEDDKPVRDLNVTNGNSKADKSNILVERDVSSEQRNIAQEAHMPETNRVNGNYEKTKNSMTLITKLWKHDSCKVEKKFHENHKLSLAFHKHTLGNSNHNKGNKGKCDSKKQEANRVTGNDHNSHIAASSPKNSFECGKSQTKRSKLQCNKKWKKDKDKGKVQGLTQNTSKSKSKEHAIKGKGRVKIVTVSNRELVARGHNTNAQWKKSSTKYKENQKPSHSIDGSKRSGNVDVIKRRRFTVSMRNAQLEKRRAVSTTEKRGHQSLASRALLRSLIRDLKPERIVGATELAGKLLLLMKCEGREKLELVPAKLGHRLCPQAVIQFYQSRLVWQEPQSDSVYKKKCSSKLVPSIML